MTFFWVGRGAFKGSVSFFHAVVLAGTPPSTDFKSIYSNQFKRYEYIQDIWEMQNFMKNTMIKFFWRARTSARAPVEYSASSAKIWWFCSFHSDMRFGVRRERKCARAQNFISVKFVEKSFCDFFGFFIAQKAKIVELFEVS